MTERQFNYTRNVLSAARRPAPRRREFLAGIARPTTVTAYCGLGEYVDIVAIRRFNDGFEGRLLRNGRWQKIASIFN